jgi:TP901 family phage tail tape measure protein
MPLSVREVLLVLRAKDQASRVIADVGRSFNRAQDEADAAARRQIHAGQALLGVGVAMAATGAAGIAFYGSMINAAVEYQRQSALTLTQVSAQGATLQQVEDIARRVGSQVGAPFDQMQTALYDIFSSTDANLGQAEMLLDSFARTAVAGQVDIQTAGRATIAILNSFKLPLEDVNRVEDIMFKLVQKGQGTYEEFASTIGRSIPSAVRAGQSIEDLSGMLAFLTRNGLSTAMASASAARALDSYANPKIVDRLEKMGIKVKDSEGNFRAISDVVTDLAKKTAGMKAPELAKFLDELFKGAGGTIQARRFWDTALKNPEGLAGFTADMKDSAGAMKTAYDIMADSVAVKTQLLKNNWEILKTYIGEIVLPIFLKAVDFVQKIVEKFISLDPHTKKLIVWISLATFAAMILFGILLSLAGIALIIGGVLELLGIGLLPLIGLFILGALAIGGMVLAIIWLYNNSAKFKDFVDRIWQEMQRLYKAFEEGGIKGAIGEFWRSFKSAFSQGWQNFQADWDGFLRQLGQGWDELPTDLKAGFTAINDWLAQEGWPMLAGALASGAEWFWDNFTEKWAPGAAKAALDIVAALGDFIGDQAEQLYNMGLGIAGDIISGFWQGLKDVPGLGWLLGGAESMLKSDIFWKGIPGGNPFDKPEANPLAGVIDAGAIGGALTAAGAPGYGWGSGYMDQQTIDVHDNVFQVADLSDFVSQMENFGKTNNKAVGAAQPSAQKGPPAKTKAVAAAPKAGKFT